MSRTGQECIRAFISGCPLVVAVCNTSVLMLNRATTIMIHQNSVSSQRRGSGLRMNHENGLNVFCLYYKQHRFIYHHPAVFAVKLSTSR